jgi:membrane-associated phospholipid phosphatase
MQLMRNEYLDAFFKFLNFFDTPNFYYILLPVIWIGYNRKFGIKLTIIMMLSSIVNDLLKNIFMLPRPSDLDITLAIIQVKGYGFPSGGAQSALLLPLIFIDQFKYKKIPIILGSLYFFLISFSRLYLGVHFLTDIFGGWIVGGLIFLIYKYLFPYFNGFFEKKPLSFFWIYQLILLPLLFIPKLSLYGFALSGVVFGLLIASINHLSLSNPKNIGEFLLRTAFVISGIFLLYFLFEINIIFDEHAFAYVIGFWVGFLCPYLYRKIFLKNSKIKN